MVGRPGYVRADGTTDPSLRPWHRPMLRSEREGNLNGWLDGQLLTECLWNFRGLVAVLLRLGVVAEVGGEPLLGLFEGPVLASGVVPRLVASDLGYAEIFRSGVREVVAADRGPR